MSNQELLDSIQEYNVQLEQVGALLLQTEADTTEQQQLQEVQQSLLQVLELSLDQLQQQQEQEQPILVRQEEEEEEDQDQDQDQGQDQGQGQGQGLKQQEKHEVQTQEQQRQERDEQGRETLQKQEGLQKHVTPTVGRQVSACETEEERILQEELALFNSEIAELEELEQDQKEQSDEDKDNCGNTNFRTRISNFNNVTKTKSNENSSSNNYENINYNNEYDYPGSHSTQKHHRRYNKGYRDNKNNGGSPSGNKSGKDSDDNSDNKFDVCNNEDSGNRINIDNKSNRPNKLYNTKTSISSEPKIYHNKNDIDNEIYIENKVDSSAPSLSTVNVLLSQHNQHLVAPGGFIRGWTTQELQQLHTLEGAVVRAPLTEAWGGHTYHNALVMSLVLEETGNLDDINPQAVVLFSQPTSAAMLPCKFFLEGRCHYQTASDDNSMISGEERRCSYSHGHTVDIADLRPYHAPDPNNLQSGSKVLCRHLPSTSTSTSRRTSGGGRQMDLWHRGVVEDILVDQRLLSVECSTCKAVVECRVEEVVLVIVEEDDEEKGEEKFKLSNLHRVSLHDQDLEQREESEGSEEELPLGKDSNSAEVAAQWIVNPKTSKLGEWEKHTKGIGWRLLQKMGYKEGDGLGKNGEGRMDPVPAFLYPAGVSLDRCMELRERSGCWRDGTSLLQVEARLQRQQEQQQRLQEKQEERIMQQAAVFDVINNTLAGVTKSNKSTKNSANMTTVHVGRQQLREDSSKSLNLKSYQLSSRARDLKREIDTLETSRQRQYEGGDEKAVEVILKKLEIKKRELQEAERAEERVSSEQRKRRETKKYVVF